MPDDIPDIRRLLWEYRLRFNGPAQTQRLYGWLDSFALIDSLLKVEEETTMIGDANPVFTQRLSSLLREANPILDEMDELAAREWVLTIRRALNEELDRLINSQAPEPDSTLLNARDANAGELTPLVYRSSLTRQRTEVAQPPAPLESPPETAKAASEELSLWQRIPIPARWIGGVIITLIVAPVLANLILDWIHSTLGVTPSLRPTPEDSDRFVRDLVAAAAKSIPC